MEGGLGWRMARGRIGGVGSECELGGKGGAEVAVVWSVVASGR